MLRRRGPRRRREDPAFARGLRQAVKKGKVRHLNKIGKAAAWQASAWVLERRWRRQFGRQAPADAGARLLADRVAYDFSALSPDELRQLFDLLNKAGRRAPAGRTPRCRHSASDRGSAAIEPHDPRPTTHKTHGSHDQPTT